MFGKSIEIHYRFIGLRWKLFSFYIIVLHCNPPKWNWTEISTNRSFAFCQYFICWIQTPTWSGISSRHDLQNIAEKILLTLTQETPIPFCGQFSLKSRHLVPISCSKLRLFTSAVSFHIFSVALSNCYAYWMYQLYRYNIYITYIRCIRTLHLLDYCEFS